MSEEQLKWSALGYCCSLIYLFKPPYVKFSLEIQVHLLQHTSGWWRVKEDNFIEVQKVQATVEPRQHQLLLLLHGIALAAKQLAWMETSRKKRKFIGTGKNEG